MEGQVWTVPVGEQQVLLSNEEDFEKVKGYRWYLNHGYAVARIDKKNVRMHRFLMGDHLQPGLVVDHRNGNKLDNRRENLRVCTQGENARNGAKPRNGNTPYKGVVHYGQRFRVLIRINGKSTHIGIYNDAEEAARVYDAKAREAFGEFARPNFE